MTYYRGVYDPAGYRTHEQQREDLLPEFDEFGQPYIPEMWEGPITRLHQFSVVPGGAGEPEPFAPAGTRASDRSHACMSSPSDESRPTPQLLDVDAPDARYVRGA